MKKMPKNGDRRFSDEEFTTEKILRCGFGGCYPKWLQPLLDVRAFVTCFGALGLISWSNFTILASQITNIEKAFGFSSSETGTFLTLWEVGYLVSSLVASYYGYKAHKPRMLGVVTMLCGISSIIVALPHFFAFSGVSLPDSIEAKAATTSDLLCRNYTIAEVVSASTNTTEHAVSESVATSRKSLAYAVFVIGLVVQGIAKAPCYPYSSAYVDDVDKRSTGFYMGIITSIGVFGLALGFGLGSFVSNQHVTLQDVDITPTDPRWIGAWWLAFIIVGVATFMVAIPMFCFPRNLTGVLQVVHNQHKPRGNVVLRQFKDMAKMIWDILSTPQYFWILLSASTSSLVVSVFVGFEPKYIETQFAIPSWKANLILGVSSISSLSVGSLIGGYLTKKLELTPPRCMKIILIMNVILAALTTVSLFLGCPHRDINNPINSSELSEAECDCSGHEFLPICGGDGITYYSPCHAGCTNGTLDKFTQCSRIPGEEATSGLCSSGCKTMWPNAVVRFVQGLVDSTAMMFVFITFIRSVTNKQKALALGISAIVTSLLGFMPGPVVGGRVIDSTCLIWNTAEKTSSLYCALYNIEQLRYRTHGLMIGIKVIGCIFVAMALWSAWGSVKWKNEENSENLKQTPEVEIMIGADDTFDNTVPETVDRNIVK